MVGSQDDVILYVDGVMWRNCVLFSSVLYDMVYY